MSGREIVDTVPGWLHRAEGEMLYRYAAKGVGPLLEVGSYCGKSTCWIGDAAKETGRVLFTVDHHRGSPEMLPVADCYNPDVIDPVTGRHDTLIHLRRTLERADLEGTVVPVVGSSGQVAPWWRLKVSFAFIDAAHDRVGVMFDCESWGPWVHHGGWLAFHDSDIPGIASAVDRARDLGFELVDECESLKVLQRS